MLPTRCRRCRGLRRWSVGCGCAVAGRAHAAEPHIDAAPSPSVPHPKAATLSR
jgi:hypothetical protein